MYAATLVDTWRPSETARAIVYDVTTATVGGLLIALCAQIEIPLGLISITGSTFGVLLAGVALGSRRGTLCVSTYIAAGLLGLPIFMGARGGLVVLAGPTTGYLAGFVAAAYLVGVLAERGWDRTVPAAAGAMALGTLVILLSGVAWIAVWLPFLAPEGTPDGNAFMIGFVPFIPGAILKITLAALLLPTAWKFLGKRGERSLSPRV